MITAIVLILGTMMAALWVGILIGYFQHKKDWEKWGDKK